VAAEVGNLDGRIPRSIAFLLTRPGFLTAEYLAGRRRGYVGPFKLFIVAYGTVLLATALLVRPDAEAAAQPPGTSWRTRLLHAIAARNGWSPELALEQLSTTFFNHMGWLQLLIPLLFGASVALVFARRHRGFVAHLVFAAHVAAFECAVSLAVLPTGVAAERLPATVVSLAGVFSIGVLGWYLWRAVERVYGEAGWRGAVRAAALLVGFNLAQGVTGLIALCTAVVALLYL
jgi:hypothetical protein